MQGCVFSKTLRVFAARRRRKTYVYSAIGDRQGGIMRQNDYPKFQAMMATLGSVFNREVEGELASIYWDALKDLAIEQFVESARSWIKHGKQFPKPADLISRWKEMLATAPPPKVELPPPDRKWLALVNGMFLRYLQQRRITEDFKGDINLAERRAECLRLADLMELFESANDPVAIEAELKVRFDRTMSRIKDADENWLDLQAKHAREVA